MISKNSLTFIFCILISTYGWAQDWKPVFVKPESRTSAKVKPAKQKQVSTAPKSSKAVVVTFVTDANCEFYIRGRNLQTKPVELRIGEQKSISLSKGSYTLVAVSTITGDEKEFPFSLPSSNEDGPILIPLKDYITKKEQERNRRFETVPATRSEVPKTFVVWFSTDADSEISVQDSKGSIISNFSLAAGHKKSISLKQGDYEIQAASTITDDKILTSRSIQENTTIDIPLYREYISKRPDVQAANVIISNMIKIDGGSFIMGSKSGLNDESEHSVNINSVQFNKYEVTQQEWEAVMGSNPSQNRNCKDCPVENVSWIEVNEFIKKINAITQKKFRLPTEAEWEYVANKGGMPKQLKNFAWFSDNSGKKTHPVGKKDPNEAGIYDMFGNVSEWCSDWYDPKYYKESPSNNPQGPPERKEKVVRGYSYIDTEGAMRISAREKLNPKVKKPTIGFRLVIDNDIINPTF